MRVVIDVKVGGIELIDGDTAGLAEKQPRDSAVLDGDDRCVPGRQHVDRLVTA